jgi:hypothetical protein
MWKKTYWYSLKQMLNGIAAAQAKYCLPKNITFEEHTQHTFWPGYNYQWKRNDQYRAK